MAASQREERSFYLRCNSLTLDLGPLCCTLKFEMLLEKSPSLVLDGQLTLFSATVDVKVMYVGHNATLL